MLQNHLQQQFLYSYWAWDQVFSSAEKLTEETLKADSGMFWGSIFDVLTHGMTSERFWLERIQGLPMADYSAESITTIQEITDLWNPIRAGYVDLFKQSTEETIARPISFVRGENEMTILLKDIVQQLVVHGVEHRSQVTPLLFIEGVPTERLGYLHWVRSVNK